MVFMIFALTVWGIQIVQQYYAYGARWSGQGRGRPGPLPGPLIERRICRE